jgi:histidinol phosphatase-like PHP family hydrolase
MHGGICMNPRLMDIHNHTIWSDGRHTPEEIIINAVDNGIDIIGISDHYNTLKCHSVGPQELNSYIMYMDELKTKYSDKIEVLCGVEICTNKDWCSLDELQYDKLNQLDFVLLEYVDLFPESLRLDEIGDVAGNLKCRVGLAHTDIFSLSEKYGLDKVVEIFKDHDISWEINVNRGYGYFDDIIENLDDKKVRDTFQYLKENDIRITVGSDTHSLYFYDIDRIKIGNELANYNPSI